MSHVVLAVEKMEVLKRFITPGTASGIITNQTCTDSSNNFILNDLKRELNINKAFTPEHGLFGKSGGGEKVNSYFDKNFQLKVVSLYGENFKPKPEDLSDIQVVFYHIQDLGLRFYTYVSTLFKFMEALHEQKSAVKLVILDRPNPLGRAVEGPMLEPGFESFVGMIPVPVRYGLTIGELALFLKSKFKFEIDLEVVGMDNYEITEFRGWPRDLMWNPPSSAIKTLDTAYLYSGLCLLEGTDLSEGRGTGSPFRIVGKPGFNTEIVMEFVLRKNYLVRAQPAEFIPEFSKYKGMLCTGIIFEILSPDGFRGIDFASRILYAANPVYNDFFDKLAGTDRLRKTIKNPEMERLIDIILITEAEKFKLEREKYFLY
ncbi:MAG TPA: DUF1343 domain-containing protein [Firmicutes bacterium]|nr:DUF1343 domain-containing protein [Bacillota bacterium]